MKNRIDLEGECYDGIAFSPIVLWNICLHRRQRKNGGFLKGEYRYFVKKTEYRVHLNLGICG